jgi:hypothetical protein
MALRAGAIAIFAVGLLAQPPVPWICPMDPDVRSSGPAKCTKCGMKLVPGIPDPVEYPLRIELKPRVVHPGSTASMTFRVRDPKTRKPVTRFELVHEKLFHLFLVSQDLKYFAHEHPEPQSDGSFTFEGKLPKPGQYRILADFYPAGGTPQLAARTIIVPGTSEASPLQADLSPQQGENIRVSLRMEPEKPLAGKKTLLFFDIDPAEGLEPYLGANGHMLVASADLIDTIHGHPAFPEPGRTIQFNVIFPRPGLHRIWVQFQREGVVNTVAFNVPVARLE